MYNCYMTLLKNKSHDKLYYKYCIICFIFHIFIIFFFSLFFAAEKTRQKNRCTAADETEYRNVIKSQQIFILLITVELKQ